MVLGKLPVPGRPTIWITVGQGPTALSVGAGGGCLDIFTLIYPFSPLSPSLWETACYRLKYCYKEPLNLKQPTNQPFRRAYQQQYTTESFKVDKRYRRQGIPMYKLKDWNDEPIIGSFYTSELSGVSKDVDSLFFIEKVLKKEKERGKTQLFVKWDGYPSLMNSWVDEDTVRTT